MIDVREPSLQCTTLWRQVHYRTVQYSTSFTHEQIFNASNFLEVQDSREPSVATLPQPRIQVNHFFGKGMMLRRRAQSIAIEGGRWGPTVSPCLVHTLPLPKPCGRKRLDLGAAADALLIGSREPLPDWDESDDGVRCTKYHRTKQCSQKSCLQMSRNISFE